VRAAREERRPPRGGGNSNAPCALVYPTIALLFLSAPLRQKNRSTSGAIYTHPGVLERSLFNVAISWPRCIAARLQAVVGWAAPRILIACYLDCTENGAALSCVCAPETSARRGCGGTMKPASGTASIRAYIDRNHRFELRFEICRIGTICHARLSLPRRKTAPGLGRAVQSGNSCKWRITQGIVGHTLHPSTSMVAACRGCRASWPRHGRHTAQMVFNRQSQERHCV